MNLLLGRLDPERFEIPVDVEAAERALETLIGEVEQRTRQRPERQATLAGLLRIADERMADAIREISVRRGYDPGEYALVAFGGAGAQHACAVAGLLGVETVVVPEDAGLLSARGLGAAVVERFAQRQVLQPLAEIGEELPELLSEMAAEARGAVAREGVAEEDLEVRRRIVHLRFVGQDSTIPVEVEPGRVAERSVRAAFDQAYFARFGYRPEGREVEVESVRVVASSKTEKEYSEKEDSEKEHVPSGEVAEETDTRKAATREARSSGFRTAVFAGEERRVPVFERSELEAGDRLTGPALVFERHSATAVAPGWSCRVDGAGALVLIDRSG